VARSRACVRLGPLVVDVTADHVDVIDGIRRRLRPALTTCVDAPHIRFDIRAASVGDEFASSPRGPSRRVYDAPLGGFDYFEAVDEFFVDYGGAVRVRGRGAARRVEIAITDDADGVSLTVNPFFTIPLLELAKRAGLYAVHGACVADDDRALLVAGGSGAGKTTLAIALARHGLTFVADDIVFLAGDADGTVHALPDEVDVTDETARMFRELQCVVDDPLPPGRAKHPVRLEDVLGVPRGLECRAAALALCAVGDDDRTVVEPVPASDALIELAPNVLLTEPAASQAHFGALARLARSVPCYRVRTGRDLEQAAATLASLVR
jgi:hypothetical protein